MTSKNTASQKYTGTQILENNELYLDEYNKYIVELLTAKSRMFSQKEKILDFGAGIGTLAKIFSEKYGKTPFLIEVDIKQIKQLKKEGFSVCQKIQDYSHSFDFIYTSNVLEHIQDDRKILSEIYSKMNPNGLLAIYVPAFPILFTDLDTSVGHFRRYKKKELEEKVSSTGFRVVHSNYADSIGFFVLLVAKIISKKRILRYNNTRNLTFYDRKILPLTRIVDKYGMKYVLGKNLILIAKKEFR